MGDDKQKEMEIVDLARTMKKSGLVPISCRAKCSFKPSSFLAFESDGAFLNGGLPEPKMLR